MEMSGWTLLVLAALLVSAHGIGFLVFDRWYRPRYEARLSRLVIGIPWTLLILLSIFFFSNNDAVLGTTALCLAFFASIVLWPTAVVIVLIAFQITLFSSPKIGQAVAFLALLATEVWLLYLQYRYIKKIWQEIDLSITMVAYRIE
jgi:hypothetical protein